MFLIGFKKEFDKLAKEKQEAEMLLVEYQFMKGIKSLCDFKKKWSKNENFEKKNENFEKKCVKMKILGKNGKK